MTRAHESGLVLAVGFGYTAPAAAGALLPAIALVVLTGSVITQRRFLERHRPEP